MINWGLVPVGAVLPFPFGTYGKTNGESITLTGLAVTDIEVYKGGSITQRSSDAGYTLIDTDGIDIDGTTGIHGFTIDTGDNTDASFYAAGSFYWVVVSAVTVDSQTVNFVAGYWRHSPAETASGVAKVDTAYISGDATAADNLELSLDDTAGAVPWLGIIDQGTAQSATATTLVLRAAAAFANDEILGATILITGGTTGVGQARAITDYVLATDTATVDTWTTTPSGTITYKIFATPPGVDATAIRAALGMASANFDTQVGGLTTGVGDLQNRVPAALSGDGFIKADMLSVNGSLTGVDKLSAHLPSVLTGLTAAGGTTTTIVLNATTGINGGVPSATNDFYNGRTVVFTSGALAGQATSISDYVGATQTLTVAALTGAPASGVTLVIV
jgi:hypothetical protein